MKKALAIILTFIIPFCFFGCRKIKTKTPETAVTVTAAAVPTATLPAFLTESTAVLAATDNKTATTEKLNTGIYSTTAKADKSATAISAFSGSANAEKDESGASSEKETVAKNVFDKLFESASVTFPGLTKPVPDKGKRNSSSFDDCAFVGNSRIMDFDKYGLAKNVFADVSLTVDTVFTKVRYGKSVTIINELNGRNFKKIYLYFGDNECGWGSLSTFLEHYGKVVDAVRERCPSAQIFILSIMPISKSADLANNYGYNMAAINRANDYVVELAGQKGVTYFNTRPAVSDAYGYLPEEAASDGVHLGKKYTEKWADYIYYNS